ncbi:unnamed protein product [Brachionus calyciflorus]|uniref:Uncharacterized protein n=1 Tax=Brachionus calyciflorus TaxID=104777 RepID=A0A813SN23_9BILA|nr:unnamed protein product [Brachionus calyciflorus]
MDEDSPLNDHEPNLNKEPATSLNAMEYKLFRKAIGSLWDLFAYSIKDLKICTMGKHTIKLVKDDPIRLQPSRKSYAEREQIKREVNEMLANGIIEHSTSPCAKLNNVTVTENWPIPRIEDILDRFSGSLYFTSIDLKTGYWQIEIEEKSKEYTAFTTPDRHYQFKRMQPYFEIYLDDIIIHSKSLNELVGHIFLVAKLLRNAALRIKPSKCSWFAKKARILGYVLSGTTIEMEQDKIYSSSVFPIKIQPDFTKTFIVYTDASGYAISGVLSQKDEYGNEYKTFYDNETEVIYYVKKTGEYVEIPPKEKRKELVKIAHEFGHFQCDTTLARVKESYFWFKMIDDVEKVIQACVACKENQLVGKLDHPANYKKVS